MVQSERGEICEATSNTQQEYIKGMLKEFETHAPGSIYGFLQYQFAGIGDENWSE